MQQNTDHSAHVTDDATTRDDDQVVLFGTLAASDADPFVMMSSAPYPQLDPTEPAMFSPTVVTDVLGDQLGFDGVAISDDVGAAKAVQNAPAGERVVRFLVACGTLVLTVDAGQLPEMIDAVLAGADRRTWGTSSHPQADTSLTVRRWPAGCSASSGQRS